MKLDLWNVGIDCFYFQAAGKRAPGNYFLFRFSEGDVRLAETTHEVPALTWRSSLASTFPKSGPQVQRRHLSPPGGEADPSVFPPLFIRQLPGGEGND